MARSAAVSGCGRPIADFGERFFDFRSFDRWFLAPISKTAGPAPQNVDVSGNMHRGLLDSVTGLTTRYREATPSVDEDFLTRFPCDGDYGVVAEWREARSGAADGWA
jgi:hypothetical protein